MPGVSHGAVTVSEDDVTPDTRASVDTAGVAPDTNATVVAPLTKWLPATRMAVADV